MGLLKETSLINETNDRERLLLRNSFCTNLSKTNQILDRYSYLMS